MVEFNNLNKMCSWEQDKAMYLVKISKDLGMDTSGYGELAVNLNSGYTYLWLEDYNFSLYMPIECDLIKSDIYALWTNTNDGEEIEFNLSDDTTLNDLNEWASDLENKAHILRRLKK